MYNNGQKPKATNYKENVSNWIKLNVLEKNLTLHEQDMFKKFIDYFTKNANKIWRQHYRNIKALKVQKQHSQFLEKWIEGSTFHCPCKDCIGNNDFLICNDERFMSKFTYSIFIFAEIKNADTILNPSNKTQGMEKPLDISEQQIRKYLNLL